MTLRHTLYALALVCGAPAMAHGQLRPGNPTPAVAPAPAPERRLVDTVAALLGGFEYEPTRDDLLAGRDEARVRAALVALLADRGRPAFVRARAAAMLAVVPGETARAALAERLADPDEAPMVLRAAVLAAAPFGDGLRAEMEAVLRHPDVHVREAAVRALARVGDATARRALAERRDAEPSALVRARIDEELARIAPREEERR